ncbi:MAG: hypothetical protein CMH27_02130 [Micavibrio sp.]|nr:hypothetical protein [Micavibrio sp.]
MACSKQPRYMKRHIPTIIIMAFALAALVMIVTTIAPKPAADKQPVFPAYQTLAPQTNQTKKISQTKQAAQANANRPPLITTAPISGSSAKLYSKREYKTLSGRILTYYWLEPPRHEAQAERKHLPLTLLLHDATGRNYAADYIAGQTMRRAMPSYVIVPVTPSPPIWAHPESQYAAYENLGYTEELIGAIMQDYPIDQNRIYVMGCSGGGAGALGALARYPDLFAAGVSISGFWDPIDAPIMTDTPLLVIHGTKDTKIPVAQTRNLVKAIKEHGGHKIVYREVQTMDHQCHSPELYSRPVWQWLFSQRKAG